MGEEITVAFWNRRRQGNRDAQVAYLQRCGVPWDVLLLAEMSGIAFRHFKERLGATGVAADLKVATDRRYRHGVAALGRGDVELGEGVPVLGGFPADDLAPRSERSLAVPINKAGSTFTAVAWHAPYAAGRSTAEKRRNPLAKQRAYQDMAAWLDSRPEPVVLGMDGNNWYEPETHVATGTTPFSDEHRFHAWPTGHGLVDTLRAVRADDVARLVPDGEPLAVTRFARGPQRMDRIYASPEVEVLDAGVDYDGRDVTTLTKSSKLTPSSDHALVWATVRQP